MDPRRFDTLARTLAAAGTRRGLLRLLAALPLGVAVVSLFDDAPDATAEDDDHGSSHRRHRRKARHRHKPGSDKTHAKTHHKKPKRKDKTPDCTPTTCAAQG